MGMTTITVKAGQKPTKEQVKRIREACIWDNKERDGIPSIHAAGAGKREHGMGTGKIGVQLQKAA